MFLSVALSSVAERAIAAEGWSRAQQAHFVTNVAQFKKLSAADFLNGCDFALTGTATFVDSSRDLIVLQDATGAVALNAGGNFTLAAGDFVSITGSNGAPTFPTFPDFPHQPATWDIRLAFESPQNFNHAYLTRMRGFIHPPVSGEYTFWIASDNSSELWLSADNTPANQKRIASIARFTWVAPREWTKHASQRSPPISLEAGRSYYIEAMHEQTDGAAHLAVAWQGPGIPRSIITATHLTPWNRGRTASLGAATNGVLREHWTNYIAGRVDGFAGARPFESALSVEELRVTSRRAGQWPQPRRLAYDSRWLADNNYSWVEAQGIITFAPKSGDTALLELSDSKAQVQLRALPGNSALARLAYGANVRVQGVCEGMFDENGRRMPGVIWIAEEGGVRIVDVATHSPATRTNRFAKAGSAENIFEGFFSARGVVTFNDRVFGKDCLFVQEGNAPVLVSLKSCSAKPQLKVGDWIELGGSLERTTFFRTLAPLVIVPLGTRAMPGPAPIEFPLAEKHDGRWTEVEGVVRSVNSNGTLAVMTPKEISVWLNGTASNELHSYIDAKVRAHGVLSLTTLETPALLVPSPGFVEVSKVSPADPFTIPLRKIAEVKEEEPLSLHRVRVAGEVTLHDAHSFLVQDASGGIRVHAPRSSRVKNGDAMEVIGFPTRSGTMLVLTEALTRPANGLRPVQAAKLVLSDALPIHQNGSLVGVHASLLAQRTIGDSQILELQEGSRIFTATLLQNHERIASIAPGSQLAITGVCDTDSSAPLATNIHGKATLASLNILLRSSADVKILRGPPWWTWQRTSALISTLLAVSAGALLWVHLLRRRLQRQKAAQLAASQQILKRLEDERRRIAANLHDSLGQVLLAIKNQSLLALQRAPGEPAVRERLNEISGATSQALEEVRQITHGLRPYQLDRLGLTQALRDTVSRASASSAILFASRLEDIDDVFDQDSEIHVYRIVQEAINNVLKHSAATEAAVVIRKRDNRVSLSIRDNGRGFDVAAMRVSQSNALGYGLSGIAERVRILGGELTIDARPGGGTSLNVEISVSQPCPTR